MCVVGENPEMYRAATECSSVAALYISGESTFQLGRGLCRGLAEVGNDRVEGLVERKRRLPFDGSADLVDAGHAPLHVLKALFVGLLIRHAHQSGSAAGARADALGQRRNGDLFLA